MRNKNEIPDKDYLNSLRKHNKPKVFKCDPIHVNHTNLTIENFRPANTKQILS